MAGFVDDEAELPDPILRRRHEEASFLDCLATFPAACGDALHEALLMVRRDRRDDDPVGRVQLLEGEAIPLKPFDAVVQRATNHIWLNTGTEDAVFVGVMIGGRARDKR